MVQNFILVISTGQTEQQGTHDNFAHKQHNREHGIRIENIEDIYFVE